MRPLILLLMATLIGAAESAPTPSPRDIDPVTQRRAQEALATHAAAKPASTADLALLDRLTAAITAVQEGQGLLAKQAAMQAGERYIRAAELIKTFTPEERLACGERWTELEKAQTALGRALAESDGLERAAAAAAIAEPKTP